ncbi:MAG: glycoside hydrolase family 43 protein [Defluviitaleaceae bacterium]|nr:glycoside hydrolase family 43 protein [Defluviitaleaceae bacterium]MCL2276160.1 glycoside hydrolase family 43 protein [Defluviitaleaceae bacterium]
MKTQEINVRDPYVLLHEGKYYMYGTRSRLCWDKPADINTQGFDVYVSADLENWDAPVEVFTRPQDFWADRNFWAPEVHVYKNAFYLFATFIGEGRRRGTQILRASSPLGPFTVHSDPITPPDWECLDGTLYVDKKGTPYMVFCHEWVQIKDGTICAVQLTDDLSAPVGEPRILFAASAPHWADKNAPRNVTDGPFFYRTESGALLLFWSSLQGSQYVQAVARSSNGDIDGAWEHLDLLYEADGGHGMVFTTKEGTLMLTLHTPNVKYTEYPVFIPLQVDGDRVRPQ